MAPTTETGTLSPRTDGGGATTSPRPYDIEIDPAIVGSWHTPLKVLSAPIRKRWLDISVYDRDNVPAEGPAIIAANHLSFIDSPLLMTAFDRPVTFLGKAEYMAHRVTRYMFPRAGMIPVDRTGRGIAKTLGLAQEILENGGLMGIFPEGSRSRDGNLHRGHHGAAHLALKTGAPIIPVGIVGSNHAMPVDSKFPVRNGRILMRIGAPIGLGPYLSEPCTAATKQALTDEVMREIAELSGQAAVEDFLPIPS
ncbi:MAG: lysophospholipid acyltransferase family protein [Actinomycetota bacterium]